MAHGLLVQLPGRRSPLLKSPKPRTHRKEKAQGASQSFWNAGGSSPRIRRVPPTPRCRVPFFKSMLFAAAAGRAHLVERREGLAERRGACDRDLGREPRAL